MFKLTRAFVIAAAVSSAVLCAPIPQDVGKPISTGQSTDPSAPASSVFGTTAQDPNYQSHPTGLCIVPNLAKDAGLSQGQEQLTAQQAIQLCPQASTIAVSSKNSKRGTKVPPAPIHHPDAPHPARSVDERPPKVELPHKPTDQAPRPPVARDIPPQHAPEPQQTPKPLPDAPKPHVVRDLPPKPDVAPPQSHSFHPVRAGVEQPPKVGAPPQPSPEPLSQPDAPRVVARSKGEPHHDPQPDVPQPVAARSAPKAKVPSHAQPLPATLPRPSQLV